MSMTETLFGGFLLAVALFLGSRRLGLSNFWAGILSGALPFIAYLAYSARQWPGGDVLAIHFVVYLATAGVLMSFGGMQRNKEKMHWAPRLIIAFFVVLVILMAGLLSISMHGLPDSLANLLLPNTNHQKLHTAFPGVVPHELNRLYEPHLRHLEQQRNLGWQVDIAGLEDLRSDVNGVVTVKVHDAQGKPVAANSVTLDLWRMANSGDDRKLQLKPAADGTYTSPIMLPDSGHWIAELHIMRGQDSFLKQQTLFISKP